MLNSKKKKNAVHKQMNLLVSLSQDKGQWKDAHAASCGYYKIAEFLELTQPKSMQLLQVA